LGFCGGFRVQDPDACPMTFANTTAKCDYEYYGYLGNLQAYAVAAAAAAADSSDSDKAAASTSAGTTMCLAGSALASSECHCLNTTAVNATTLGYYNAACAVKAGGTAASGALPSCTATAPAPPPPAPPSAAGGSGTCSADYADYATACSAAAEAKATGDATYASKAGACCQAGAYTRPLFSST